MSILNPHKVFIQRSGASDYRLPYEFRHTQHEIPNVCVFDNRDFEIEPGVDLNVVKVIAGNRARISLVSDAWLRGSERSRHIDFASQIQNQYRTQTAGREIQLRPRARALLVWEFVDGKHAFAYLDATRDSVNRHTLATLISAEDKLRAYPRVRQEIRRTQSENASRQFTDFSDATRWSTHELLRLEHEGVIGLDRDQHGRITGIAWAKEIARKKIAIFQEEQVGYRQCFFEPTTFGRYQRWGHEQGVDIGGNFSYDPKIAMIQKECYDLLGI